MGIRYEAWTLPWDTAGFTRKFHRLPTVEGTGRGTVEFLTAQGDGMVDVPLDAIEAMGRSLDEIVSDTTSSLIRVIDCLPDGTNTIIDEWVCERPAKSHSDSHVVSLSGPKLKGKAFDGLSFPAFDSPLNPSRNPDHIFGGDNILQDPGFENGSTQSSVYHLLIDATAGTFTLSIGSGNSDPIPFDTPDGQLEIALEDELSTGIDDVSVSPLSGAVSAYRLRITAESGTFILSDGTDDTDPIAFNASAATIETRIVADISAINDVDVSSVSDPDGDYLLIEFVDPVAGDLSMDTTNLNDGSATLSNSRTAGGFEIEFVSPAIANLTVNPAGLTGDASVVPVQQGQDLPSGWTKSQQISAGTPREYGVYTSFHVSESQAHSGTKSLFIDPGFVSSNLTAYAGTQQVISVEPGQLYQASIWVYATAPGQQYRLVVREIDEDLLSIPLSAGNITPPANTWTQIVLPEFTVPEGQTQVIFRFASIMQNGNPAGFYVDDGHLAPGMAANTWGHIINYFMDLKSTEYAWVDYSSITDALDSGGATWPRDESVTGYFGESFGQFWDKGVDLEYEWDLVPKDTPAGGLTHDLVWHVSEGLGDTSSRALYPNASISGGDTLTRVPAFTKVIIEGSDGLYVEVEDATAVANFGPIEKHVRDVSLHSVETLTARANAFLSFEAANRNAARFEIVEHLVLPRPGVHFKPGDTIPMQLPPGLTRTEKRVQSFSYTNTVPAQYLVTGSRVLQREAAAYNLLWRLWRRFQIPTREKRAGALSLGGGGGMAHVLIVSDSEPQSVLDKADYTAPANESASYLQEIFDAIATQQGSGDWSIWMAGIFDLDDDVTTPNGASIRGLGYTSFSCST